MEMKNGVYLILDPAMEPGSLLRKLKQALLEDIAAVQIWDHFKNGTIPTYLIEEIQLLCQERSVPVLINNRWELLKHTYLDGVHFDSPPHDLSQLKTEIGREFIVGITCNNDLNLVKWAQDNEVNYLSFCSMFPSSTSNSCELVSFETVRRAREITTMPIFLAGGIRPDNLIQLEDLDFSGIAVISGVMNSNNPAVEINKYNSILNTLVK